MKRMTIQRLLSEHGIRYTEGGTHQHVREGWLGLDCPWCGSIGKFHLGIHLTSLRAFCWRCGRRDLAEALALIARMPVGRAKGLIASLPRTPEVTTRDKMRRGMLRLPEGLQALAEPHQRFLRERGFNPDLLERLWGLRGIGLGSWLSWRIWAPVCLNGKVVTWTTRSIGTTNPRRWLHAPPEYEALPIKMLLYGWDHVRNSVVIVEGPSDVWRVGPGAVALFGVLATTPQIRLLSSVPRRVICFDREPEAQRAARLLAEQLSCFPGETSVVELSSADPGEASDDEVEELRSCLEPVISKGR